MIIVEDCLFENYGEHPVTFGDSDKILTHPVDSDSKQRLDYIMHLKIAENN